MRKWPEWLRVPNTGTTYGDITRSTYTFWQSEPQTNERAPTVDWLRRVFTECEGPAQVRQEARGSEQLLEAYYITPEGEPQ